MKRNQIITLIGLIAVAVIAFGVYSVLRTPAAPTAPIEAVPIDAGDDDAVAEVAPTAIPTEVVAEPTATERVEVATEEATPLPEPTEAPTEAATEAATEAPLATAKTFEIIQNESTVSFTLNEVLRGQPTVVVGTTDQVAGQIRFNPDDLSDAQIGTILVNARALQTDNNFRNRAIQNRILVTGDYEFITFEPTDIIGLPSAVSVGDTISFEILGDLTIRDITLPQTFIAEVAYMSEGTIEGTAIATVLRPDYDLQIPSVQDVADVDEAVVIEIAFTALALDG